MYQIILQLLSKIPIIKTSGQPIYLQISVGIIGYIKRGQLNRGLKLPGTRVMAKALDIHRRTLQMALDELVAQGWLEIIPRRGTFVSKSIPELKPVKFTSLETSQEYPDQTNFNIRQNTMPPFPSSDFQNSGKLILTEGFPDIRMAPIRQLFREIRSIEKRGSFRKYLHYGDPQGTYYLREILASYINDTRTLPISPGNIVITKGAQMGLYLAAQTLLKPGDQVVVGDPSYHTATLTLARAGGIVNRIPVDESGIVVDELEELCKKKKIKLIYVIPHHHHPTTVTLTPKRRIQLLDLANRYKFAIVEDDYDYDFHYKSSPVVPMASLDKNGNVIYIGTLSKTLVPALRVGFLIAPENFIREAVALRRSIDFQGDSIMEVAIAELYRNGVISSHIKKAVKVYRERRDHFCELLKEKMGGHVSFRIPDGGLSVWCHFKNVDLVELTKKVARYDVLMTDGQLYNTSWSSNATRLGFSSLDFSEQERALDILLKSTNSLKG